MVLGIAKLFNDFGGEVLKLDGTGIQGLVILTIFGGIWAILYSILSKNGEKKTAITKWIPPLVSFLLTLAIVIDPATLQPRDSKAFLLIFKGILGFVLAAGIFGYGTFLAYQNHKKQGSKWSMFFFMITLFVSSTFINLSIGLDFSGVEPKLASDSFLVKLGMKNTAAGGLLSLLGIIQSVSLVGAIVYLLGGFFGMKWSSDKPAAKGSIANWKNTRSENIKKLDAATRKIETLMKQGSQIYKEISEIVKDKKDVGEQVRNMLNTWKSTVNEINSQLREVESIDPNSFKFRLDPRFEATSKENFEKIKLGLGNLRNISSQMDTQIDKTVKNIRNNSLDTIYSDLYNIAMGWYNFAKGYGNLSNDVSIQVETYKMDLDIAEKVLRRENILEGLSLQHITDNNVKEDFKYSIRKAIDELFSENNKYVKSRRLRVLEVMFKEMDNFVTPDNYDKLKELNFNKSKENNLFVHIYMSILDSLEKEYVKGEKVETDEQFEQFVSRYCGPNQVKNLLVELLNKAGNKIKSNGLSEEANKLGNFISDLNKFKDRLDNFSSQLKLITEVKNIKDYVKNNGIDFNDILSIMQNLLQYDLNLLKKTEFKNNPDIERYIKDLENHMPAIETVINNLNGTYSLILRTSLSYPDEINEAKDSLLAQLVKFVEVINTANKINQLVIDAINAKI